MSKIQVSCQVFANSCQIPDNENICGGEKDENGGSGGGEEDVGEILLQRGAG